MPASLAVLALVVLVPGVASTPSAGRVTLVAGEGLNEPFGVAFDEAGNVYIVAMGGNRVSVLRRDGTMSALAGTGEKGFAGDGGPAAKARFNGPHHLLMGPDGRLYVADTWNNAVRRIDLKTKLEAASGLEPESRGFADPTAPPDPTTPNVIKPTTPWTYRASVLRA